MNGPHDMGGMQCFGPVVPESDEPVFHAEWEKRALAMTVAMGFLGRWNLDQSRHARESLRPDFYLSHSYYQIWIAGLERLMLANGLVTEAELEAGAAGPRNAASPPVGPDKVPAILSRGGPVVREARAPAAFAPGQAVRTRNLDPVGHTRLPRYARAKTGKILLVHGCHVFPDSNAAGEGENPQWLYTVAFEASQLFGETAEADHQVMVDCWEPYLEPA